ncbi:hypothetical protein HCA61_25625 [Rhodococcus sp. HNM0563]|uniref:thioesterase domain-containing protein n=1 Tax=Rhodococcus sp. HNM0563 TaxID=2716339 RepID=UPI00146D7337|nr:hypothetical protein [Rhodococcus sp. HNM0563]
MLTVKADGEEQPLWCVHPAGGVGWPYFGLESHIGARPIYALQSDGLTEAAVDNTIADVVARYVERILAVQNTGPFNLLGWSYGGVIAHAVAVELQMRGHDVELLALVDSWTADESMLAAAESDDVQDQVEAAMWSRYESFHLADDPNQTMARIAEVSRHSIRLLVDHGPRVFQGDALLIQAGLSREGHRVHPRALRQHWTNYIAGVITDRVIPCRHDDFDRDLPMSAVGRAVENWFSTRVAVDAQTIDNEGR